MGKRQIDFSFSKMTINSDPVNLLSFLHARCFVEPVLLLCY